MPQEGLTELYIDELKDLYNAETQLVKALPKMAKAASNAELRQGFEEHLRQTSEHVSRLEQIFEMLGEKASGKKCLGMEGLVKEGSETMSEDYEGALMDAALIGAIVLEDLDFLVECIKQCLVPRDPDYVVSEIG